MTPAGPTSCFVCVQTTFTLDYGEVLLDRPTAPSHFRRFFQFDLGEHIRAVILQLRLLAKGLVNQRISRRSNVGTGIPPSFPKPLLPVPQLPRESIDFPSPLARWTSGACGLLRLPPLCHILDISRIRATEVSLHQLPSLLLVLGTSEQAEIRIQRTFQLACESANSSIGDLASECVVEMATSTLWHVRPEVHQEGVS